MAAPESSGLGRSALALARASALALGVLVALLGCGGGARTACVVGRTATGGRGACPAGAAQRGAPRGGATTARSEKLVVTLTVVPVAATVGSAVQIELTARARHAPGALGYLLRYGDGTTSGSGAVPQFCIAGAAPPSHRTWHLAHRYGARGRYMVSASVYVNCTSDRATAATRVLVR